MAPHGGDDLVIHPDTTLRWVDEHVGFGVFATRRIPRGTITWVLDPLDRLFDDADLPPRYQPLIEKYTYRTAAGKRLLAWDLCRYMNHSCEANTFSPGLNLEVAVRDIEPGEQLTSDYAALNLEEGFTCMCGASGCRTWVADEQFELLAPQWDELIRAAFSKIPTVEQPLWDLVSRPRAVLAGVRDGQRIPSVLSTRCAPSVEAWPSQRYAMK